MVAGTGELGLYGVSCVYRLDLLLSLSRSLPAVWFLGFVGFAFSHRCLRNIACKTVSQGHAWGEEGECDRLVHVLGRLEIPCASGQSVLVKRPRLLSPRGNTISPHLNRTVCI